MGDGIQSDILWQTLGVYKSARAAQKQQTPRCNWFTGLSGSGDSTLANLLEQRLHALGQHTYEPPPNPDVHLLAAQHTPEQCVDQLMLALG